MKFDGFKQLYVGFSNIFKYFYPNRLSKFSDDSNEWNFTNSGYYWACNILVNDSHQVTVNVYVSNKINLSFKS